MRDERPPRRAPLIVGAALTAAMALLCVLRLRVTTDITHFLPAGTERGQGRLSRQLADSALTRNLILSIGADDLAHAKDGAKLIAERLSGHPEVAWIQRGPTDALAEAVYKLYAPRLPYFVSDQPETELPSALSDQGLARAAAALKRQLMLPTAPLIARLVGTDPLQWFPAILHRLERAQARALDVDGDQLITRDHRHAIVFVGLRHSPFDSKAQGPLDEALHRAFDEANRIEGGALTLEQAGVGPIALDAEHRMRGDLTRISALSTAGVLVLFFVLFGSLRSVIVAFLPIVAGALGALTSGILIFGTLHAMTLAIGSSLVGVAIDYPILLLTHRILAPGERADDVVRRVWIGILLGGLTTAAGFVALAWTSFPGVREMAVTSAFGILTALGVTRYVLPALLDGRTPRAPLLWRSSAAAGRALAAVTRRRWLGPVFLVALAALCVAGLPRLRWLDSLAALNAADPRLKAETDRVRARISNFDDGRLIVASAPTADEALRINDQVAAQLARATAAGALDGAVSLHAFIWSSELQRRNSAAIAAAPALGTRVASAFEKEGFRAEALAPFLHNLASPPATAPLRLEDLQSSPIAPLIRPFVVDLGDEVGVLTFLRGIKDAAAVEAAVAAVPGATLFDQAHFLDRTYARFRVQTLQAIGVGLVLILLVLHVRYRAWRRTLGALLPAVVAAAATLGLLGLLGTSANLLHVLSLLLVLSMGVDYGVFLAESADSLSSGPTLVSLCASCGTTLLSFGVLGLSSTPALRAIGVTVGVGIVLSLVLAPLALAAPRAGRANAGAEEERPS